MEKALRRLGVTPPESGDLDDLRRDMIVEIGAAMVALGWVAATLGIGYDGRLEHLLIGVILMGAAAGSIWLRSGHLRAAIALLIAAQISAVAVLTWLGPRGPAPYYFLIAVVVSGLLVSGLRIFGVAAVAGAACVLVLHWQGVPWLDDHLVSPVLLTLAAAFATWLGSRQVHMALGWLQNSYARTRDLLEQVRDGRASLARTLKSLEDAYVRIEKMNYALIEARAAAEDARRLKAEFAANVSHELRTPLNIILGFSETMANAPETYAGVTWTPALRGDIEQIYQSSRHLSSLIDDILDLSALDARQMGLAVEETTIQSVVDSAVAVVHDLFRAKRLYLRVDLEPNLPPLRMDTARIRQVLINLLTNASRFTHEGGVTIRARLASQEIEISVADTGVGIAAQDIPKVFEDFVQVDGSASRRHEGTGLGVPISKRIVQLHGGRMWLESEPGKGTTFYFTLPITTVPRRAHGRDSRRTPPPPSAYRKAVIVLEPDPVVLRVLRRHLSGCDVIALADATHLAKAIAEHNPIALLVDRHGNGEAPMQVKELGPLPSDLPVITVDLPGSLRSAQALGIEGYLIKPILREQLLDAIARLGKAVQTVLVVDDDPAVVELICRMLQSAGETLRVVRAYGGIEALQYLHREHVDLVLLDLLMPEVSGVRVLEEMKADATLAAIPVIVISAQDPEMTAATGGLFVSVARDRSPSLTEAVSLLQALLGALPVRGLPGSTTEPELSTAPPVRRASSDRPEHP